MDPPADHQPMPAPRKYDHIRTAKPSSFTQWQLACAFVKYLYLQGSHHTCVAKCDELLKSPKIHTVHEVFVNFYAGLCHETIAETLGTEHKDYHAQLDGAEHHLITAFKALPLPQNKPTAFHVRQGSYEAFKRELASQHRSSSESSRPSTDLQSQHNSKSSQTTPASPDCADEDACLGGARGRYNRLLMSLKPELDAHISYVQTLRQDSTEALSRSNSHAGSNAQLRETMAKVAVKQRVVDGRKRNWKRARFSLIPQPASRLGEEGELA